MGDMEAEMARFEEEIASGGDGPEVPPPILPPPMFLPHSLQSGTKDGDNKNKEHNNSQTNSSEKTSGNSSHGPRPMGPGGPGYLGPNGPRHGGPGPMGPGGPGPMGFSGPMGPGPNFSGPMGDGGMIGPLPPPMPGFFPPPVMPDFSDFMASGDNKPTQSVYSAPPVLSKKVVEVIVKQPETSASDIGPASATKQESTQAKQETFAFGPPGLMYGGPQMMYGQNKASSSNTDAKNHGKKKKYIRTAAGNKWEDQTLLDWDPNDYRIFCGDLGNEVTDDTLARVFNKYPSFQKAKVVREKNNKKSRGYGFVSFKDPSDFIRAMREMNGKYVGNRPIKLRKSTWKDRNIDVVRKKVKEKKKLGYKI